MTTLSAGKALKIFLYVVFVICSLQYFNEQHYYTYSHFSPYIWIDIVYIIDLFVEMNYTMLPLISLNVFNSSCQWMQRSWEPFHSQVLAETVYVKIPGRLLEPGEETCRKLR